MRARPRLFSLAITLLLCFFAARAMADVPVRSALLVNLTTGATLYQKSPDMKIPPASLTKVMTAFLVLDAIREGRLSMNAKVRVPNVAAAVGGSSMKLRAGETTTVSALLHGMLIASGNDAATALAYKVAGRQDVFVAAMNKKARQLGMKSTTFRNPTGLPAAGQLTTARDMLTLCRAYITRHPEALRIHRTSAYRHGKRTLTTTNPFLGEPGIDGLKTGFTASSGYNIVVTGRRNGTRLMAIVLGGRSKAKRNQAAGTLIRTGFKNPGSPAAVRKIIDGSTRRTLKNTPRQKKGGKAAPPAKKASQKPATHKPVQKQEQQKAAQKPTQQKAPQKQAAHKPAQQKTASRPAAQKMEKK